MHIALIGWQGGGKSTLFTALTGDQPDIGAQAHPGVAEVADSTLDLLYELWPKAKKVPAKMNYLDIAGLAHTEERTGFKRSMVNHLQSATVLAAVIGTFHLDEDTSEAVTHVQQQAEDIEAELLLSDLATAENRAEKIAHSRQRGLKVDVLEEKAIQKCLDALNDEKPLRELEFNADEEKALRTYAFLSQKPLLIVVNHGEHQDGAAIRDGLTDSVTGDGKRLEVLNAELEAEIAQLEPEDRGDFLADLGVEEPASERVIRLGFDLLGLIRFFTVGDDEVRSWPIPSGLPALEAAGEIHSDLQRGFIRAEVVPAKTLLELGSLAACKDKGVLRLEGKTYIVQDGDVMHVRFAV